MNKLLKEQYSNQCCILVQSISIQKFGVESFFLRKNAFKLIKRDSKYFYFVTNKNYIMLLNLLLI